MESCVPAEGVTAAGVDVLPALVALEHRLRSASGTSPRSRPARWRRRPLPAWARGRAGRPASPSPSVPRGSVVRSRSMRARQGVGHHQGRRGQVVEADVGVDAAFEVAVARQHRRHRQVALVHRLGDAGQERARVADARRAPEADELEAERLERLAQPGPLVVVHDDPRPGGERRLHPRLGAAVRGRPPSGPAGRRPASPGGWTCWCSW